MDPKPISQLTDDELQEEARKIKPAPILDVVFIGFLVGVLIYGAAASAWGFAALIPLVLIYLLLKKSKRHSAVQTELAKRKLT